MTLEEAVPSRGYLLVEPEETDIEKKAKGAGLILADNSKFDRPQTGRVIKVGDEFKTDYGAVIDSPVTVGQRVIFKKWGGNEIKIDNKEYFLIRFDDIIGKC